MWLGQNFVMAISETSQSTAEREFWRQGYQKKNWSLEQSRSATKTAKTEEYSIPEGHA